MSERVFCKDCRWIRQNYEGYECVCPSNAVTTYDWLSPRVFFRKAPKDLNAHNDCTGFEAQRPVEEEQ